MNNNDLSNIEIRKNISTSLFNRLMQANIKTLDEVSKIDLSTFSKEKGVGKGLIQELQEFQTKIAHSKEQLFDDNLAQRLVIDFPRGSEIMKIEFRYISELLEGPLLKKMNLHNIKCIDDLALITFEGFSKLPRIGETTLKALEKFIINLKSDPSKYLDFYYESSRSATIPIDSSPDSSFLELFMDAINDYLEILKKDDPRSSDLIARYYGLNGSRKYFMHEIGLFYEITYARVGQLINVSLNELKNILGIKEGREMKVRCRKNLSDNLCSFQDKVKTMKVFSKIELLHFLKENFSSYVEKKFEPYLMLLLELIGVQNISRDSGTSEDMIFFTDKKIDKQLLLETGKILLEILEKEVVPVSRFDLIVKSKKINKSIHKGYIDIAIRAFSEIEELTNISTEIYQIRLDKLSSAADMAERILYKLGKSTHIDDLVSQINVNLYQLGSNKSITKTSVLSQLRAKKHIVALGRTGVYSFLEWEENTDHISQIIRKAFLHNNRPLSLREIIEYVKKIRPSIKTNSIRSITNMDYIRLDENRYILQEWASKYKPEIMKKRKPSIPQHNYAITILSTRQSKEMKKNDLIRELEEKHQFAKAAAYAIVNRKKYFEEFIKEDGTKWIKAIEPTYDVVIPKKSQLKAEIIEYVKLSGTNGLRLKDLTKHLSGGGSYSKQMVYKVVSGLHLELTKIKIGDEIWIRLKNIGGSNNVSTDWDLIELELSHDVQNKFIDIYSTNYAINFSDAVQLLKNVIDCTAGENGLDGLQEQITPSLLKFYKHSNDKNDLLNYFKQFSTSLDPFLKKILFLVNRADYINIKQRRLGLGRVIEALNRLDPDENRYVRQISDVTNYKFAEDMYMAYTSRNSIAHEAKLWGKQQIINNAISSVTIYLYAIYEYHSDIRQGLAVL